MAVGQHCNDTGVGVSGGRRGRVRGGEEAARVGEDLVHIGLGRDERV